MFYLTRYVSQCFVVNLLFWFVTCLNLASVLPSKCVNLWASMSIYWQIGQYQARYVSQCFVVNLMLSICKVLNQLDAYAPHTLEVRLFLVLIEWIDTRSV